MNKDEAIALLRQMVEIPSRSGQEGALATFLTNWMKQQGMQSFIDEVGNAVGVQGRRDGPVIMLLGHMDTVAGEVPVRQEGNLLYGRGSVDAKGPLATFLCAAAGLADLPVQLMVVGAVEEETAGSRGAHHLLQREAPDAVIIGEPSGWSGVVIGYKGRISFTCEYVCPQSHSAGPGEKASENAVDFWNRVAAHCASFVGKGQFDRPVASLSRIEATAEEAKIEISCRIPPGFDVQALRRFLEEHCGDGRLAFGEVTPAVLTERSTPPARALLAAIRQHSGSPGLKVKTGTSDMNTVSKGWQVPMVAYGPGDSSLDHTPHEHLDLEEYLRAIAVLTDALRTLASELAEAAAARQKQTGGFTDEEEEELSRRLAALGYLE